MKWRARPSYVSRSNFDSRSSENSGVVPSLPVRGVEDDGSHEAEGEEEEEFYAHQLSELSDEAEDYESEAQGEQCEPMDSEEEREDVWVARQVADAARWRRLLGGKIHPDKDMLIEDGAVRG